MSTNIVRASRIVILQIAVPIIIFSIGIFITPALIGSSNMEILFMTQEICIFAAMSLTYKIGSQSQVSSQILTVSTNSIRSYGKSSYVNGRGKDHSGSDAMILKATSPVLLLKLPVSDRVHVRSVMDVPTIDYSLNGIESFELE